MANAKPIALMLEEMKDYRCEECGANMVLRWSRANQRWFYGCGRFSKCTNTFDADQKTGAPIPNRGRPERLRDKYEVASFWEGLQQEDERFA